MKFLAIVDDHRSEIFEPSRAQFHMYTQLYIVSRRESTPVRSARGRLLWLLKNFPRGSTSRLTRTYIMERSVFEWSCASCVALLSHTSVRATSFLFPWLCLAIPQTTTYREWSRKSVHFFRLLFASRTRLKTLRVSIPHQKCNVRWRWQQERERKREREWVSECECTL